MKKIIEILLALMFIVPLVSGLEVDRTEIVEEKNNDSWFLVNVSIDGIVKEFTYHHRIFYFNHEFRGFVGDFTIHTYFYRGGFVIPAKYTYDEFTECNIFGFTMISTSEFKATLIDDGWSIKGNFSNVIVSVKSKLKIIGGK